MKKEIFVTLYITIRIVTLFEDEIVNNKAFERVLLILGPQPPATFTFLRPPA